ncbi:hypothetical protein IL306_006004, partial [Fusarium sp. DS 682]
GSSRRDENTSYGSSNTYGSGRDNDDNDRSGGLLDKVKDKVEQKFGGHKNDNDNEY